MNTDMDLERFADLLAGLIEKYIDKIDLDSLPDPPPRPSKQRPTTDDVVGSFFGEILSFLVFVGTA